MMMDLVRYTELMSRVLWISVLGFHVIVHIILTSQRFKLELISPGPMLVHIFTMAPIETTTRIVISSAQKDFHIFG
jgi:hypothetical protein